MRTALATRLAVRSRYETALARLHVSARPRILVVDDNLASLSGLRSMLSSIGEVATQSGAGLALELLREQHFDLIVLDLAMPEMDGYEFAAELRGLDPSVPVIAVSGTERTPDLHALNGTGRPVAFLRKPPRADELRATVHKLLIGKVD